MSDDKEFGPAMAALNERQRAFVMAMIEFPGITQAKAAERAGYQNSPGGMRVQGHYLAHHPGVQAAIREEAGKRLNSLSLLAANVMADVMLDPEAPLKEKLKAAAAVLDRTGFAAAQNINVNKTVTDNSGKAVLERIERAAAALGIDPTALLGLAPMKVINHGPANE
jgi:phage terminase small subunit